MPFDQIEYGEIPLIRPLGGHPAATTVPQALQLALMHAFGYARSQGRMMGTQTHPLSMWQAFGPGVITNASVEGVTTIRGYVPKWATHLIGDLTFGVAGTGPVEVNAQILTSADTGAVATSEFDRPAGDLHVTGLGNILTPSRATPLLELSATTIGADVVVTVRGNAVEIDNGGAALFRPHITSVWWLAVG